MSPSSRLERAATLILAALLFAVPLLHSGGLADPFDLPKQIAVEAAALFLAWLALTERATVQAPRRCSLSTRLCLALLAAAAVAAGGAPNARAAVTSTLILAAFVALSLGAKHFVRRPGAAALAFQAILASAALVSAGIILQVFVPGLFWMPGGVSILPPSKAGATLGEAGLAVQFLVVALPAGLGAVMLCAPRLRPVMSACLGLVVTALVFAGRPEGWLTGGLVLALFVLSRFMQVARGDRQWTRLVPEASGDGVRSVLVVLIVALAIIALGRIPGLLPDQRAAAPLDATSLLSPTTGDPAVDRAAAASGSLALIGRHPLGVGPGNWRIAFLEVAWTRSAPSPFTLSHQPWHAGNDFLERAAEMGVLGGSIFILLVLVLAAQGWAAATRAPAPWNMVGLVGVNVMLATSIAALYGEPFEEPAAALVFWTMAGMIQEAASQVPAQGGRLSALLRVSERAPGLRWPLLERALALLCAAACIGIAAHEWERVQASRQSRQGMAEYYAGRYQAAVQAFDRKAVQRSADYLPRMQSGTSYLRLGFNDLAVQEFSKALARSPWFLAAYLGRATAYQALGRYDLADEDLRAALRIWPDNSETRLALARLDASRGRLDAAIDTYTEISRKHPNLAEPYFQMGLLYLRRGQVDEAIEAFRVCGLKNPTYPKLATAIGDAFFKKGLLEMALRAYQGGAASDEKDADVRLKIANTQHALGQLCDAQESLEAARDLETDAARRSAILDLIKKVEPDCVKERKNPGRAGAPR